MTHKLLPLLVGAILTSTLHAQDTTTRPNILEAILLPRVSDALRKEGVPEEDVRVAIEEAMRRRVPPAETKQVLDETAQSVRESGPIDNFGAFVQTQLDAGLRGRELAAAIHAEHARRGIGKGKKLGVDKAKGGPEADKVKGGAKGEKPRTSADVEDSTVDTASAPKGAPPVVKVKGPKGERGSKEAEVEAQRKKDEAAEKVRGRRPKPDSTRASGVR